MSDFAFGDSRWLGCCGKPVGCTMMPEGCVFKEHIWKRQHIEGHPRPLPAPGGSCTACNLGDKKPEDMKHVGCANAEAIFRSA